MTLRVTDFSEYESNGMPPDWIARYNSDSITYYVRDSDWEHAPGKYLEVVNSTQAYKMLSWNKLDNTQNFDALFLFKASNIESGYRFGPYFRATYTDEEIYCNYVRLISDEDLRVGLVLNGIGYLGLGAYWYSISKDGFYFWMRIHVEGSHYQIKCWQWDHVEPERWFLDGTNTEITDAGWWGFGAYKAGNGHVYWLGVDTDANRVEMPANLAALATNFGMSIWDMPPALTPYACNFSRIEGGLFLPTQTFKINKIGVKIDAHTDIYGTPFQIRLGVYSGGTPGQPGGATLVCEVETTGEAIGYQEYDLPTPKIIPVGQRLWIAHKGGATHFKLSASLQYYASLDFVGGSINKIVNFGDTDPDIPFPATCPSATGTEVGARYKPLNLGIAIQNSWAQQSSFFPIIMRILAGEQP